MTLRIASLLPLLAALLATTACRTEGGAFSVYEENDLFTPGGASDRYYTQGARASWTYRAEDTPTWAQDVAREMPLFGEDTTTAIGVIVGQSMYVPEKISLRRPQPNDRPWAGWLYTGILLANVDLADGDLAGKDVEAGQDMAENRAGDTLETFEFDIGVVGPSSQAEPLQKLVHKLIDSPRPRGWRNQLKDEVGLVLSYGWRTRLAAGPLAAGTEYDVIGGLGATVGNVFTHAETGVELRVGHNLPRDFGVNTIRRTAAEVWAPTKPGEFSWYAFGGADGWAVGRNIFLDGNTFRSDGPEVDKEYLVAEFRGGIALQYESLRLTYSLNTRTREFRDQNGWQKYGSLGLQWLIEF